MVIMNKIESSVKYSNCKLKVLVNLYNDMKISLVKIINIELEMIDKDIMKSKCYEDMIDSLQVLYQHIRSELSQHMEGNLIFDIKDKIQVLEKEIDIYDIELDIHHSIDAKKDVIEWSKKFKDVEQSLFWTRRSVSSSKTLEKYRNQLEKNVIFFKYY